MTAQLWRMGCPAFSELVASTPNAVWSWDITKLRRPAKWTYRPYVILDVFSRYVVGWMVASRESAAVLAAIPFT